MTEPVATPYREAVQKLKYYQKGTFTVGNRLVTGQRFVQASQDRSNALTCGHRACQGCGEALGARYAIDAAMRATNNNLIAVNATGCLEVFTTPYPETSWQLPWLHSLFGNAAAVATGVAAAMRVKKRPEVRVIAQGGDGGTTDIGFQCLSGMFERNDDVLYICYDNEGYMNTGVQRSSATPPTARTATTAAVGPEPGACVRHREVGAENRRCPQHSRCRHRNGRRPARSRAQGHQGDVDPRRPLHPDQRALPARLGIGLDMTLSGWTGSPLSAASIRSSRRSTAKSRRCARLPPDSGAGLSETAAPLRAFVQGRP